VDGDGSVSPVVEMEGVPPGQSGVTIEQVVAEHLSLPPAPSTSHGNGRYNFFYVKLPYLKKKFKLIKHRPISSNS